MTGYLERRRICRDYYRSCRKGRWDRRVKTLRSLLRRKESEQE